MNSGLRRIALYGSFAVLAGVLGFAGFVYKPPADVETLLSCAQMQMQARQFLQASQSCDEIFQQEPGNIQAGLIQAYCFEQLKDYERAIATYSSLLPRLATPDQDAEVRVALAMLELRKNQPERGLIWVKRMPGISSKLQSKLDFVEGACREKVAHLNDAIDLYTSAMRRPEVELEVLKQSSLSLERLGQTEEASWGLERAINQGDAQAKYFYARLKFFAGDADKASAVLREMSSKDSRYLARCLRADEEFDRAVQEFGLLPE